MGEYRYIECPDCKTAIREDVKKCPHCRTRVNKRYRGAIKSDRAGSGLFFIVFIIIFLGIGASLEFLDKNGFIKDAEDNFPYGLGVAFFLTVVIFVIIEVKGKKKFEEENKKVYVDAPKSN